MDPQRNDHEQHALTHPHVDDEHQLTKIPEMVHQIQSYLSFEDIVSCTLVNHIWEVAARKHLLLHKSLVHLSPTSLKSYMKVMASRGDFCHSRINFDLKYVQPDLHLLLDLSVFASKYSSKVQHISTDWFVDISWSPFFRVWTLFTSLRSLELRPYQSHKEGEHTTRTDFETYYFFMIDLPGLIPPNTEFPSVSDLSLRIAKEERSVETYLQETNLLKNMKKIFPSLNSLQYWNWDNPSTFPPLIKSLSIFMLRNDGRSLEHDHLLTLSTAVPASLRNLTRLDFNLFNCQGRTNRVWERILAKSSHFLGQVCIRGVTNMETYLQTHPSACFTFPILPQLKGLEIQVNDDALFVYRGDYVVNAIPSINFKFVTQKPMAGISIDYERQFPRLAYFGIVANTLFGEGFDSDEDFFESGSIPVLFSSFAPPKNQCVTVCKSVLQLDIPWPDEEVGKWRCLRGPECTCDDYKCTCWTWVVNSEFYSRIKDIFPNVRNVAGLGGGEPSQECKSKERKEKLKQFVEMGNELGLSDQGIDPSVLTFQVEKKNL